MFAGGTERTEKVCRLVTWPPVLNLEFCVFNFKLL